MSNEYKLRNSRSGMIHVWVNGKRANFRTIGKTAIRLADPPEMIKINSRKAILLRAIGTFMCNETIYNKGMQSIVTIFYETSARLPQLEVHDGK